MIRFTCPKCGKAFKVGDEAAGKRAKCKACGEILHVPQGVLLEPAEELPTPSPQPMAVTEFPVIRTTPVTQTDHPCSLELHGLQEKTVRVEGNTIRIMKKGWLLASQREKTLPIRNISSVEVKKPGALISGFIQFSIAGGAARDSSFTFTGGAWDATQDENSVLFIGETAYGTALKIKAYVETYQEKPTPVTTIVSTADEILKLKALMDQGVISHEEFEMKKRRLMES